MATRTNESLTQSISRFWRLKSTAFHHFIPAFFGVLPRKLTCPLKNDGCKDDPTKTFVGVSFLYQSMILRPKEVGG